MRRLLALVMILLLSFFLKCFIFNTVNDQGWVNPILVNRLRECFGDLHLVHEDLPLKPDPAEQLKVKCLLGFKFTLTGQRPKALTIELPTDDEMY